jgi:hypothetical protein
MVTITFRDREREKRALGFVIGRFSHDTLVALLVARGGPGVTLDAASWRQSVSSRCVATSLPLAALDVF